MYIYFFLLVYWLLIYSLVRTYASNNHLTIESNSNYLLYICGLSLFLIMALRDNSVGTDIQLYLYQYNNNIIRSNEVGINYLNEIFHFFKINNQMYLVLISGFTVFSIQYLYAKFSKSILLSNYLHVTMGLFAISMTGIRQTLAVCITIYAFMFINRNKKIAFFFLILLAYFFHNSALVFISVFFVRNITLKRKQAVFILGLILLIIPFQNYFISLFNIFIPTNYSDYINETEVNHLVLLVNIAISGACILFWPEEKIFRSIKYGNYMSVFLIFSLFNIIINVFSNDIVLFDRLTFYFTTYITVLIPNIIMEIKDKRIRRTAITVAIIISTLYFFIVTVDSSLGIDSYKFFWEDF